MMLDIIITTDPVIIVDSESTDPDPIADTIPGTTKAVSSSCPRDHTSWKAWLVNGNVHDDHAVHITAICQWYTDVKQANSFTKSFFF